METKNVPDLGTIRHMLDLARSAIHDLKPDLAVEYLRTTQDDCEDYYKGSEAWAEHHLLVAEAYASKGDSAAEIFFAESIKRIRSLPDDHRHLLLRAYRNYGCYLARHTQFRQRARQHYEAAKQLAVDLGLREDSAEIELKIVKIDVNAEKSSLANNFATLRSVANHFSYTHQEQLAAWHLHWGKAQQSRRGRRFARDENQASEDYFRRLLESVRVLSE
jgi:hypothetical protein